MIEQARRGEKAGMVGSPNEVGFALAVAIFGLVLIGILVTTGFFVARQEERIGMASEHAAAAFYLAELGINETILGWTGALTGLSLGDSTVVADTIEEGIWTVIVRKTGDRVYFLDSTGTVTRGGQVYSGASRRVGLTARAASVDLEPAAALTTRGATSVRGTAEVNGLDLAPAGWSGVCSGGANDKPGVLIDDSTNVSTQGSGEVLGAPPVQQDTTIADSTFSMFGGLTWAELAAMADKSLPGGNINNTAPVVSGGTCVTSAPLNWGDPVNPAGACGGYFPIIHIAGTARMQSGGVGQGILLVDGDLDLRGNFVFAGIIIVQGNFETQGSGNRVFGGVIAGNADFDNQVLTGGSVIQNSSCAVERSVLNNSSLSGVRPLPQRGWVDLTGVIE